VVKKSHANYHEELMAAKLPVAGCNKENNNQKKIQNEKPEQIEE